MIEVYHQPNITERMQQLVRDQRIKLGLDYVKIELEPSHVNPPETPLQILKEK